MRHSGERERPRRKGPEERWQVTTASGYRFVCRSSGVEPNIELRLTLGESTLIDRCVVSSAERARQIAQRWLRIVVAERQAWS